MIRLAVLLLLAGCAATEPPPAPPAPRPVLPEELAHCPGPVVVPPAPKAPRSFDAIVQWGVKLDAALVRSEAARAACARRLGQLHEWVAAHP